MSPGDDTVLWNPSWHEIGGHNAIISSRGAHVSGRFAGALSLKFMAEGQALWHANGRRFRVSSAAFLVLNHGTEYEIERDESEPSTSFCPFFARGFVEGAAAALARPASSLLDDPGCDRPFALREQLYSGGDRVGRRLRRMARALRTERVDAFALEDSFAALATDVALLRDDVAVEVARVPALRASTREELYTRLQRARERIHDGYAQPLSLASLARTACLSLHHFHRAYRAAFGETPHAMLSRLRLERAQALLRGTEMPVTEICAAVGFESLGSFSSRFRCATGVSPSEFRKIREARAARTA